MSAPHEELDALQTDIQALIQQAQAGSLAAFERIMILHERRVFRIALATLRNPEDAGDASQEVFLRVHRGLGSFRHGNDFLPWLYRITINVCRDIQRKRRVLAALSLESLASSGKLPEPADTAIQPDENALLNERRRILSEALDALPRKERSAVVLRDIEGLSAAEAGAVLGSSESTIRSHASRARAKIRAFVEKRLKQS
jgi:RNA polymerase sigma-70 factor (ECF subfamily)